MRRAWCRFWHAGRYLGRSIVGGGLKCRQCGASFVDLADAGMLDDVHVFVPRPGMEEPEAADSLPTSLLVRQGGQARKVRVA